MSLVRKCSFLPVTSLEFVTVEDEELLMAGEGPEVKAFSKDGQLLCTSEVLPFRVVHGIKVLPHEADLADPISRMLLVFGQKAFRATKILKREGALYLQCLCEVVELSDWILDMNWVNWKDSDNYQVVLISAHNVLTCYAVEKGVPVLTHYRNEVSCILYSALVNGSCLNELMIASGTVFNKILLWHVEDETPGSNPHICVNVSFTGHQGVIFSVKINSEHSKLVSASDDRTIRLWSIPADWRSQKRVVESESLLVLYGHSARVWMAKLLPHCIISIGEDAVCKVWSYSGTNLHSLKGHKGKSIWSMAVDRENKTVATGGGDCSIRVYSLSELLCPAYFYTWMPPVCGQDTSQADPEVLMPRSVFLLGQTALCLMDQGFLFAGQPFAPKTNSTMWLEICRDSQFSGYSVGALSPYGSRVLALGNIHGFIKLLKLSENGVVGASVLVQPYGGKVFSLNWTLSHGMCGNREVLFSCGPDGKIICWAVEWDPLEAKELASMSLPPSKHRWLTTVTVLPHSHSHAFSVLCGDRKGSIHLYRLSPGDPECREPYQSLLGVHGPNGVTYSCPHEDAIYTCGRNGLCRKFRLGEDGNMAELTRFKPVKGLEWIEKIHFTDDDLLVFGFHGANLIVHSTAQNRRILDVSCGGGHRSYAISSLQEMLALKRAQIVFIKQAEVCSSEVELTSYFTKSLFQQAFLGLEAASPVILDCNYETGRALVAVGSEDCSICLLKLCPEAVSQPGSLEVVHSLQGHVSSVKALSSSCCERILLFSGGARASLKVWSVVEDVQVSLNAELFLHEDVNARRKQKQRAKFKPLNPEVLPECRIMSLTSFPLSVVSPTSTGMLSLRGDQIATPKGLHYVAAGCSDAIIRQFVYNESESSFYPLQPLKFSNKCVLSVKHFIHQSILPTTTTTTTTAAAADDGPIVAGVRGTAGFPCPILCSTNTDGHVALWNLRPFLADWKQHQHLSTSSMEQEIAASSLAVSPVASFRAHQSGINDLAIQIGYSGGQTSHCTHPIALVSAGDDNALALTYLSVSIGGAEDSVSVQLSKKYVYQSAHSSAVTGVCFIGEDLVLSTSTDQRLNIWKVSRDNGLELVSSHTHDVADPSSLAAYDTRESGVVTILCGVGLQYYTYRHHQTEP